MTPAAGCGWRWWTARSPQLDGVWQFLPLGEPGADGGRRPAGGVQLQYAGLPAGALEAVISPVFDRIANTFVDCFVQRAEGLHGAR